MKKEICVKIEWDTEKTDLYDITEEHIQKGLFSIFLFPHNAFTVTKIENPDSENNIKSLELCLFAIPEYKIINTPSIELNVNGSDESTALITMSYNLDIVSDKRFDDMSGDERDEFIAMMDAELHMLNHMFIYEIIEKPTHDGLYRYILRSIN